MEVVERTGLKRPLEVPVTFCIQCGQIEAILVDSENDLSFCSKKCQEAYHCYIIPETPWNQLKRQFYVTHHLLRPDMITKYLLLVLQCDGVMDIVHTIISIMIGNSLSIYLSPERINAFGPTRYIIGGHGLCSQLEIGGIRICRPLCELLGMAYDSIRDYLVLLIRDEDDEGGWGYKYYNDRDIGEQDHITNTEGAVAITGTKCTLIIRYSNGVSTLYGRGHNTHGVMGFGEDMIDMVPRFHQITGIEKPMMVSTLWNNTMVIDMDGSLWATGANNMGQLGLPLNIRGIDRFRRIDIPMSCIDVACTSTRIFFIAVDGQLWESDLIGVGFVRSKTPQGMSLSLCRIRTTPTDVFVIDSMGYVWVKGENKTGLHGLGHIDSHDEFVCIPGITDAVSISYAHHIAYIYTRSGALYSAPQAIYGEDTNIVFNYHFLPLDYLPRLKPVHKKQHIEQ